LITFIDKKNITAESQSTNDQASWNIQIAGQLFGLRHSFLIRYFPYSTFVIRH